MSMNRVILAGRLKDDPVLRYTQNEEAMASFRLSIAKDTAGKKEVILCLAWGGLAKIIGEYLKKGKLVAVEGRLRIRTGPGRPWPEVVVENMQMLDSKFYFRRK